VVRGCGSAGVEAAAWRNGSGASGSGGRAASAAGAWFVLVLRDEVVEGHVEGGGHSPCSLLRARSGGGGPRTWIGGGGGGGGEGSGEKGGESRRTDEAGTRLIFNGLQFLEV
jgi:hypothetical protein